MSIGILSLVLFILLTFPAQAATWFENLSVQRIDAPPINGPQGYYREVYEIWSMGPVYGGGKYYLSYQENCAGEPTDSPQDVVVASYDTATGQWAFGVAGKTKCHKPHNLYAQVMRFPDNYPNVALRGRLLQFYIVNPSTDVTTCANPSLHCNRYTISTNPDDVTSWGPVQYMHDADTDAQIYRLPMGGSGGFDSTGMLHIIGQGSGSLAYSRMDTNLKFKYYDLIKGTSSNVNSPGCVYNARMFADDTIFIAWGTGGGDCNSAVDPYVIRFAKSTDRGNTWTNVAGTYSFTKEAGIYFGNATFNVRAGYPYWFEMDRLSDGTPLVVTANSNVSNGHPIIWKWSGSGATWNSYVASLPASHQYSNGAAINVIDDNHIIVQVVDAYDSGNMYEYIVTNAGTTWNNPIVIFPYVSGSRYTIRLRDTLVTPPDQNQRILLNWTVWYETPVKYHNIYFLDRLVSQALTQTYPPTAGSIVVPAAPGQLTILP